MKGFTHWDQSPYTRLSETEKKKLPYVCAVFPFEGGFAFEWFDRGSDGEHTVVVHKYETFEDPVEYPLTERRFTLTGLDVFCDYDFTVRRADGSASSARRLVRTGRAQGTVVNYFHPEDEAYNKSTGRYLGSPGIVRLPSGKLFCSMDLWARSGCDHRTFLFRSEDGGENWHYVTELSPCCSGKLFFHRGKLYMLACGGEFCDLLIGCSEDEGETWSAPTHIVPGIQRDYGCHRGVTPIIEHNGRLYAAFEYGTWEAQTFCHSLLSIDADADLMQAGNWVYTEPAQVKQNAEGMSAAFKVTAIEGNAVALPDGSVAVMLRMDPLYTLKWEYNRAMLVKSDPNDPEAPLTFDRIVDMPCGQRNKFAICRDPDSGYYFAVCNKWESGFCGRWHLVLAVSEDCIHWSEVTTVADAREDKAKYGVNENGYSYPDFTFDGDDIIVVSRTADNRPCGQHDNNLITFHRVRNYKQYIPKEQ